MAVILYKAGSTNKVNGIPCQIQICNEYSYLHLLDQGWKYTPEECYPKVEEPELVEIPEEIEKVKEPEYSEVEIVSDVVFEDTIRKTAKEARISNWHNKSIGRLVNELKELENV